MAAVVGMAVLAAGTEETVTGAALAGMALVRVGITLAQAGMAVAVTGTAVAGMAGVVAGIMVVTAAAGELAPRLVSALRLSEVGKGFAARLLNNLSPRNRAFGYRRVVALIGVATIPNRRCRCTGIRRVIVAVVIGTIIGSGR